MPSIELKENPKPKLRVCQMLCDTKLHPKLDEYDLTSFLNTHSTTLFIGRPKSGKTSLLYSFFKSREIFKGTFDKVFLFQPAQSRASMKDKLFDSLPEEQLFEELTLDNLESMEAQLSEYNNVAIFDDMSASLKDSSIRKKLKELVFNRRHKHLTIIFLVQTYLSVEKDIRKLFSNLFVFKTSKAELELIFEELVELPKDYTLPIMKLVYDVPHQYLFINTDSQRMFKGFDEIIFED
jgi:hypothetical protein